MKEKSGDQFSEKEAQARFEAALEGALKTSPKPLKDKPKLRPIEIPGSLSAGPKRGRPPKGERAMTNAERAARGRAELNAAGARSHAELVREAKRASTRGAPKKPKKKPGK